MFRMIQNWWRNDRVRVLPGEGRLLRLRPPCWLGLGGRIVEVVRRSVGHTPEGPYISYLCLTPDGAGELRVRPAPPNRCSTVRWLEGDGELMLQETDVEVW